MMADSPIRTERVRATRERILATAERLFVEHGVYGVSNRQISEAAGQGNNTAVGYHFGAKPELVRAIVRKHNQEIEKVRLRMVAEVCGSEEVRDWLGCLIRPLTEYLADLGSPTWFARFSAQIMTDPTLRTVVAEETVAAPSLRQALDGLEHCLPDLPEEVRSERKAMARELMLHMCAERERALAEDTPTPRANWYDAATGLIDALLGLWLAPVTTEP